MTVINLEIVESASYLRCRFPPLYSSAAEAFSTCLRDRRSRSELACQVSSSDPCSNCAGARLTPAYLRRINCTPAEAEQFSVLRSGPATECRAATRDCSYSLTRCSLGHPIPPSPFPIKSTSDYSPTICFQPMFHSPLFVAGVFIFATLIRATPLPLVQYAGCPTTTLRARLTNRPLRISALSEDSSSATSSTAPISAGDL